MSESLITLITGGSRSGKSRFALEKIQPFPRKVFLATATAFDPEMEKRIQKHRAERSSDFLTLEEPLHLGCTLRKYAPVADALLVDCLTLWLNNLFHSLEEKEARREIEDFLAALDERPGRIFLVTNEISMGVIGADPATRRFVDEQGRLNQEAARRADEVVLMVAGIPQYLKKEKSFA